MKKLLDSASKSSYLIDKIELNVQLHITNVANQKFDYKQYYKRNQIRIKKTSNSSYVVRFCSRHNLNRSLRKYLKRIYEIKSSRTISSHDDNFIPLHYYSYLSKKKDCFRWMRKRASYLLKTELRDYVNEIIEYLALGPEVIINQKTSLKTAEIHYDISTMPGRFLVNSKSLKNFLKGALVSSSSGSYVDDKGNTTLTSLKEIRGAEKKYLSGYFSDKSKIKIYTKEVSKDGVLNRFEMRVQGYRQIKAILGSSVIENREDFLAKIDLIGDELYRRLEDAFELKVSSSNDMVANTIKELCIIHFKENYEEVLNVLVEGSKKLFIGKNSGVTKKVGYKIREIARNGGFLKKLSKACYGLDMSYLNQK